MFTIAYSVSGDGSEGPMLSDEIDAGDLYEALARSHNDTDGKNYYEALALSTSVRDKL